MSTDHTALTDAAINEVLHATMPDGSSIRASVKVDVILALVGIESASTALRVILGRGVQRHRGRGGKDRANV